MQVGITAPQVTKLWWGWDEMMLIRGLRQRLALRKHSIKGSGDDENDGSNRTNIWSSKKHQKLVPLSWLSLLTYKVETMLQSSPHLPRLLFWVQRKLRPWFPGADVWSQFMTKFLQTCEEMRKITGSVLFLTLKDYPLFLINLLPILKYYPLFWYYAISVHVCVCWNIPSLMKMCC